ncbi:MAG: hypothetical protein HC809_16295 [Gammaproteobacteria bacterium]|nr:hypothetical protein [Gammaproteobacteria bacterium]
MRSLVSAGQTEAGVACFIEYWNQTPWSKIPQRVREQLIDSAAQIAGEAAAVSADPTQDYPIRVPVHLMYGDASPAPIGRIVERLGQKLTQGSVERVSLAGHLSLLRDPEKFLAGILGLIRP